jgi:hypothetical protein
MATFTLPDGTVIDPTSGQTIGSAAPAKLSSKEATQVAKTAEGPMTGMGLINQLKWGTNSALLALPDAVVSAFGRAAGLPEDEVFSFTKYFNQGEIAPQNMVERYARTIGNAIGAGLPFTGALGALASTRALSAPLTANSSVVKRLSKDMLDTIRNNPIATLAADLGFGATYGALEQSVEEFVEEGEYKGLAKATVPLVGVMAVPAMLKIASNLPTVVLARESFSAANKASADPQGVLLQDIKTDPVLNQMMTERSVKFPGLNWAMGKARNIFANQAAKKVNQITREMTDPELVDVQSNIRRYEELVDTMKTDPILSKMGLGDRFLLDAAQVSLYGPILAARNQVVQNLSGAALKREQIRQSDLENLFAQTFEALSPGYSALGPSMPFDQAMKMFVVDYSNGLKKTMDQIKGITDEESLALSDRIKPVDMFDAGDSLRSMLVAQMDGVALKLRKEFQMLTTGTDLSGVPIAQRKGFGPRFPKAEEKGLEIFPSTAFANFAENLLSKYRLSPNDRLYSRAGTSPTIELTKNYYDRYLRALEKVERETIIPDLVAKKADEALVTSGVLPKSPAGFDIANPQQVELIRDTFLGNYMKAVNGLISGKMSREKAESLFGTEKIGGDGKRGYSAKNIEELNPKVKERIEQETGSVGKKLLPTDEEIETLRAEARKLAKGRVDFKITGAEAMDFLSSAVSSRGYALMRYNRMVETGEPEVVARQVFDKNNALAKDVEDFFERSFTKISPELGGFVQKYRDTFSDGYQKLFPLLISKKTKTGEYLIPNERVVQEALKSGENIRALRTIFGEDNQFLNQTLSDVMLDQAYKANVINKETGLLDTSRYSSFLKTKSNLLNQMPDAVQKNLNDELKIGEEVMRRVRELEQRKADVEDVDFFREMRGMVKVGRKGDVDFREGADPRRLIAQAIDDPSTMRQLVDKFGNKPERLEALRRQVWKTIDDDLKNPENPTFLKNFLKRNGKSLNMLYTPQHLENLRFLADVQERIFTGVNVIGKTSPFLSADEKLRQLTGAGVGTFESTARAAAIRQISYMHAGVNLMARMITRQQTNIYDAILYKALTDPAYANELAKSTANINTPAGVKQMAKLTSKAGHYFPAAIKIAGIEGVQALEQEREIPYADAGAMAPPPTAQGPSSFEPGLRGTPEEPMEVDFFPGINSPYVSQGLGGPAPQRRPQPTQRVATIPKMPAPPDEATYSRFAKLFPQDFVSSAIESRQP